MYDIVIIGSGCAGMSAGIYAKRSGLKTLIIESDTPGGQLNKIGHIKNYLGFNEIDGPSLSYNMYNHVNKNEIEYLFDEVIDIENNEIKKIITKKKEIFTKHIVLATGRTPKKTSLESEEKFIGKGISYCAICDAPLYKNKDVVIVGSSKLTIEEGIYLSDICKNVTLICKNSKLKVDDELVNNFLSKSNTKILYNTKILEFIGTDIINSILIKNNDKEETLKVDGVFIYIGFTPNNNFIKNLNIVDSNNYVVVDNKMQTKLKGIYACGDIIKKDVYQISTAIGEGAVAAIEIKKEIDNNEI